MSEKDRYEMLEGHDCDNRLYFNDGKRRIDYVLAYLDDHDENIANKTCFENCLKDLQETFGLQIEIAGCTRNKSYSGGDTTKEDDDAGSNVNYIKIHAPIEVLYNSAEDLKMKMPTKLNDININKWYEGNVMWDFLKKIDPFQLRHPETHAATNYFVSTFDKERLTEFVNHDNLEHFFSPTERGRLVYYVLKQVKFGTEQTDFGICNLIHKGVLLDAYPLHDGPLLKNKKDKPISDRQRLQKDWASVYCIFKYQPIGTVKEYFGEKIALYFSWLGFYTMFLTPSAIVGICCFIYGVFSAMDSPAVLESCSDPKGVNGTGHLFYMCPLCDTQCTYYLLNSNCLYSKVSHLFDNEATLFFAVFMSIWATVFLEFWKRRQIELAYEWHSMGFEDATEPDRPEYLASNLTLKLNPVNLKQEPHMPKGKKIRRMMGTFSVVSFFVVLVLVAVIGVMVFRAALSVALVGSENKVVRQRSKTIVSIAAGAINLVAINILRFIYNRVAVLLTDWENPRTRTEYENSFTIKMFLFQFFNTYSSIIYVAFLKSEAIIGSPGRYRRFGESRFRMDGCSAQGCFLELTMQLIIIMVGQQFISNVIETLLPTILKWMNKRKAKKDAILKGAVYVNQPQWVDDYKLEMQTRFSLFWQYLEIVLQYGFVTMFVAAFPLAPFFALLNNIIEIRVDAYNYIYNRRRPVAQMAESIGAWYNILATLTTVSVLINACVLAFTSELIPSLVYKYTISSNGTMDGFVDWSLSSFNVRDFSNASKPLSAGAIPLQNQCRYPGYHEDSYPYDKNITHWIILTVRLAFVLCFVIFVTLVSWIISYIVPDIPRSLELKIKRESFLASQADRDHKEKTGKRKPRVEHNTIQNIPAVADSKQTTNDEYPKGHVYV